MGTRLKANPRDPRHQTLGSLRERNEALRELLAVLGVERDLVHEFDVRLALVINRLFGADEILALEVDFEHVLKLEMEGELLTLQEAGAPVDACEAQL